MSAASAAVRPAPTPPRDGGTPIARSARVEVQAAAPARAGAPRPEAIDG
jgi:hypothetical protein